MRLVIEHVLAGRAGHIQRDRTSWRIRHLQLERHNLIAGAAEPFFRKREEASNSHFVPPIVTSLDDARHKAFSRITCLVARVQSASPQLPATPSKEGVERARVSAKTPRSGSTSADGNSGAHNDIRPAPLESLRTGDMCGPASSEYPEPNCRSSAHLVLGRIQTSPKLSRDLPKPPKLRVGRYLHISTGGVPRHWPGQTCLFRSRRAMPRLCRAMPRIGGN